MYSVVSKLFIAGEYAVVSAGYSAIIQPIPLKMYADINPNNENFQLSSSLYNYALTWQSNEELSQLIQQNTDYRLVLKSIEIAYNYLSIHNIKHKKFSFNINSQLHNTSKQKYGLGSSGAVVVLTIKSILAYHDIVTNADLLFKLSALVLLVNGSNGSMGDIACIAYQQLIRYTSFDRAYIATAIKTHTLAELIAMPWPNLAIDVLETQVAYKLLIGWTGQTADTDTLVAHSNNYKQTTAYQDFLTASQDCVEQIYQALVKQDLLQLQRNIILNRQILQVFAKLTEIPLETDTVKLVLDKLNQQNIAAKTSGAGVGDCIIAFAMNEQQQQTIITLWQQFAIVLLQELDSAT